MQAIDLHHRPIEAPATAATKEQERLEVKRQTEQFLANGGEIKQYGASTAKHTMATYHHPTKPCRKCNTKLRYMHNNKCVKCEGRKNFGIRPASKHITAKNAPRKH